MTMNILWTIIPLLFVNSANATETLWQDQKTRSTDDTSNTTPLQNYRLLGLDEAQLQTQLAQAALPNTQARSEQSTLSLPLPDGGFASVTATPSETLAPEIAAEHPDIQTWKVVGTDGKVISGVIDFTPQGFHAMLDMANGDTLFIEPKANDASRDYVSFRKSANREAFNQSGWSCASQHSQSTSQPSFSSTLATNTAARSLAARTGETIRTYRIAIAATAEYTSYQGGQDAAYSAIVTAVNRINQIYERDLAIRLILVSNTNLVFTNATTDPYHNSSSSLMLTENTTTLNSIIGSANYDIGHVLATNNGGLASSSTACGTYKAQGATGLAAPKGDAFIIDYVAHEIGHQLGASHTFNSLIGSCGGSNREKLSAFEPGSGSTIMSYTGLCGSDNLQANSDSMMHSTSIQQIQDYLVNGAGASCAGSISPTNTSPIADAGSNYTIPASTPFTLVGAGLDSDGNTLTYSWEQIDAGSSSNVNVDTTDNALIRAHLPMTTPLRTIPQLSDLTGGVQSAGEALPVNDRALNFRLTVRDGLGGTDYKDMKVTVSNTGSAFAITEPSSTALVAGSVQNVQWTVAGTDLSPINCSAVDIASSTDDGNTFTTLLSKAPNNGSATVTLPNNLGSKTYLRVKCSDNIFFALSATTPAQAKNGGTGSSTTSANASVTDSSTSSSSGGGSMPLEWALFAGIYALLRRRKGIQR
ncbi:reprolysin-like metallopeptidase [Thiothrix lacustris]|uniref:reprolysin-like metallopeptidase n=1 Tax=Thiothrix lacustris TaxID=525917 RepID=UPI00068415F1|nr:M12 family metallo-peptidase [Thiothrix lacustris]